MFVTIIQNVCQYWYSAEKSNAGVSLDTVSRFFRALPIMTCSLALQQKILADLRIKVNFSLSKLRLSIMFHIS